MSVNIPIEKPANLEDYKTWSQQNLGIVYNASLRLWYESAVAKILADFANSPFWTELMDNLKDYDSQYQQKTGYPLLSRYEVEPVSKPYSSVIEKNFRKNILENTKWPDHPGETWIRPDNWFSRLNDIIRTFFVIKYLDGVSFLAEKIQILCEKHFLGFEVNYEGTEEGYYAVHLNLNQKCKIRLLDATIKEQDVKIEIQITTQLQEVIRKLLHYYYERKRLEMESSDPNWKWNYTSDLFSSSYVGHILHYVEGMILQIRDKQEIKK